MNRFLTLLLLVVVGCTVNKGTSTIHPYSGNSVACGNFVVYKLTEDETGFVSLIVNASSINFEKTQIYAIEKAEAVKVDRKKYEGSIGSSICNDVLVDLPKVLLEESAREGLVEITLNDENLEKARNKQPYRVTITLKNVIFESMAIDYLLFENVYVGWLPG